MSRAYVIAALIAMLLTVVCYFAQFHLTLRYGISDEPSIWGSFGDYLGGVLNPIFSFISIVLLIKSLRLQNEANLSLRDEIKNSEKTEKMKTFESLFFNIISSQKELFDRIEVVDPQTDERFRGIDAALWIEHSVEAFRAHGLSESQSGHAVQEFIKSIDLRDQVFGVTRTFYIAVKLITERLGQSEGFDENDRKPHFLTLINFTDYAQIRLLLICIQFMDFYSVGYLRQNEEFKKIMAETGLQLDLY